MPVPLVLLAAEAVKLGSAYAKGRKAKKEAEALAANRPFLPTNKYAEEQQSLAASELSSESHGMNAYNEKIDQDLSNSLGAILKGGGDVNDVGSLFDGSQQGRQRALMMSDNLRLNKINQYIRSLQGGDQANQQQFQFNQWAPWADRAQANAQARIGADTNTWGAIDSLASTAARFQEERDWNRSNPDYNFDPTQVGNIRRSTPSVSSQFQTIDPNKLNNWSLK